MAKVFTFFDLLHKAANAASTEKEKQDLINQLADFCENSGIYFDNDEYFEFEDSVVKAIDFGNSFKYNISDFNEYYNNALTAFLKFKNYYINKIEEKTLISYLICSKGKKKECAELFEAILKYPRRDIEIVLIDCSKEKNMNTVLDEYEYTNLKYFAAETEDDIENELFGISKCEGIFVFPINEDIIFIEESIPFIAELIIENPQISSIFCPNPGSNVLVEEGVRWEIVENNNSKLIYAKEFTSKTGYGFKKESVDLKSYDIDGLKSDVDLYRNIAKETSQTSEIALFCLPIYAESK